MEKIKIVKAVVNTVISIGVGSLFGGIAKAHTPATTKFLGKVCIGLATWVLADMVAEKAEEHMNKHIDNATEEIKNMAMAVND